MAKLLQNERVKLYKKPSTWVLSGILVALMLFSVVIVKLMTLMSGGYSYTSDWQSDYAYRIQELESQTSAEENPDKVQLEKYRYLLNNSISPQDWRVDAVNGYFNALSGVEQAEQQLEAVPDDAEMKKSLEDNKAAAASYKSVLDNKDWKALLRLQIDLVKKGFPLLGMEAVETEKERAALTEVLELQISLGIEPVPKTGEYSHGPSAPSGQWKADKLSVLQANKLALLRGEKRDKMGGSVPLTASAMARLERDNALLLEELRTDTQPVDEDSFLGMLDSTTENLDLITLLMMVLAGIIIAGEFGTGTVKLLLITPHRRQKIYWAKAALLLEVTGIITGAMFILSFLASACFHGFSGIGQMQVMSLFGQVVRLPFLLIIAMKYLLYLLPVIAYTSMALMLSAVTRKSAVAIAVSLLIVLGSQTTMQLVILGSVALLGAPLPGLKFLPFTNDALSAYLPSVDSMLGQMTAQMNLATYDTTMTLGFSILILLAYAACFLWIGRDSFCRRDIK